MATAAAKYNPRRKVKYSLQLIKSLFGAVCQKAVARCCTSETYELLMINETYDKLTTTAECRKKI